MSISTSLRKLTQNLKMQRHGILKHMNVFSHTSMNERLALNMIARMLPDHARVLEIGSHIGSSALLLGAALKPKNGTLYCVDTWQNETMPDGEVDTYETFRNNTRDYADLIVPLRKRSDQVTFAEIGDKLDLAFIDGDHSEDGVRTDFQLVEDWIAPGGVIAFHDASPAFPGVNKVIGEALASGRWQLAGNVDYLAWIRHVTTAA